MNFVKLHQAGADAYFAGRFKQAERLWAKAIKAEPRAVSAYSNRGAALHDLGRYEEALTCYAKALQLAPDYAEAYSNRARTLLELRRYVEALIACERAIALQQGYVDAWINRAAAQRQLRRFDEALASIDWALMLSPDMPAALIGRGNVLMELNRHDEALAIFEPMAATAPSLNVHIQRGICYQYLSRHREAIACFDRALAIKPDAHEVISNKIFSLDFLDASVEQQQEARKEWWRHVGSKIKQLPPVKHGPHERIVLGYVSSDFRRHSAAATFWSVISNHDRERFKVICYSSSLICDDLTHDFRLVSEMFIDATQMSDDELAARVQANEVDILIDLSGHSGGNRLGTFARKPAPVQVTAWGHGTGTGLKTMDYLFSDPVTIPPEVRRYFTERIIDLPCALTLSLPTAPIVPHAKSGRLTFGVFQRVGKVSDEAAATWALILDRLPEARLLMKDGAYDDPAPRDVMRRRFAEHGIAGERIDFLGNTTREEHLAAMGQIDISLDPFPHNGGVSTWEALTQGVPVVTLLGSTPSGRIAAAILASLDMAGYVAGSVEAYIIKAVQMAGRPQQLAELRHELPARCAARPSGNAVLYTRAVERAYEAMNAHL